MYALIVALFGLVLMAPMSARAEVNVDIGIHLPGPPRLVVVPQVPAVHYVPAARANLFFYDRQYWAFANGGWHVSRGHAGPWIAVAPQFVPRPLLLVPVSYYPVRPGHWHRWGHHHPPRWHDEWGRDWAHKRQWRHSEWRHGGRDRDDDDRRRGHGHWRGDDDRGRDRDRDRDRRRGRGRD